MIRRFCAHNLEIIICVLLADHLPAEGLDGIEGRFRIWTERESLGDREKLPARRCKRELIDYYSTFFSSTRSGASGGRIAGTVRSEKPETGCHLAMGFSLTS